MVNTPTFPRPLSRFRRLARWLARPFREPTFLLACLLTIPALLPLAAPGYFFDAHDGHHSVFWLFEFDRALRDGALWPIWVPDHVLGFGYPLWLVYAPLPYFVAEAFHLLGFGLTAAVKVAWALWFMIGATGIYRLARRWWGSAAALIAALAYTYAPYHLVDIYVRAAMAEFAALALAPWVLLSFVSVWEAPTPSRAARAALALGALLLTHTMAPAIFGPLLAGLLLWKAVQAAAAFYRGRNIPAETRHGDMHRLAFLWTGVALALGFGLALIFWIPALAAQPYLRTASWLQGTYDYARHFVYPHQFFSAFWGYGFSVPGPDDGMSFQIGLPQWIGATIGALAALGAARPRLRVRRAEAIFLTVASLVALWLMIPAAKPLWDAFPLAASVQFPWRLLTITTITLSLLAGAAIHWLEGADAPRPTPFTYIVALLIVGVGFAYTRPALIPIRPQDESVLAIVEFEAKYPDMRGMTAFAQRPPSVAESPLIAQYLAGEPLQRAAIVSGAGEVVAQTATANSASARVRADGPVRLRFYTNYFPGWQATVDGQPVEITADPPDGLIGLELAAGEHEVWLRLGATPIRRVATGLSALCALGVLGLWVIGARRPAAKRIQNQ